MRVINLTMPLYEGMGVGRIYPQESEFIIESITSWEEGGARLDVFHVYCEQGTRLIMPSILLMDKDKPTVDEANIVLQDTVIVDIPKGTGEVITVEDIEQALPKADWQPGDALLIRTGWGDNERYLEMGEDFWTRCPFYQGDDVWKKIVEFMKAKQSNIFCYDTANAADMNALYSDWMAMKPRPKTWPSPEAKERMKKRVQQRWEDFAKWSNPEEGQGLFRLTRAGMMAIGGLINCGQIKKSRVKLIALPLRVKGVAMAPCHVVAIEE